jgi:predicted protein tyrosine phosphatase
MNITNIIVRSRFEATRLDPTSRYVVISISDPPPRGEPANMPKRWGLLDPERDVLCLAFDDMDPDQFVDDAQWDDWIPMHPFHAKAIASFLRSRLREGVETVVVHCNAGFSRSPSIAMAIADCMGLPRTVIDWERPTNDDPPNQHVYRTMIEAMA